MYDFGKNKTVANLDKVPDNIKPFYEKEDAEAEDSQFVLKQNDPVVAAAVGIITSQQAIVVKERRNKGTAVDLTPLAAYGSTVEEIVAGVDKEKATLTTQIADGGASVAKQIEDMKREMHTAHGAVVETKDKEIVNLTGQLDEHMLDTEITAASLNFPGLNPKLIAPFARQRMSIDVNEESGKRRVVVLDAGGEVKFSMDRPGEKASATELLEEMSKNASYQQLFPAKNKQGSDLHPNNHSSNRTDKGGPKTAAEKISAGVGRALAQRGQ